MKEFIHKYEDRIHGVLSCFDRMLFRGYLPIMSGWSMAQFLKAHEIGSGDLTAFLLANAERVKAHAQAMAEKHERPFQYLSTSLRKEDAARKLAGRDGIEDGLVCVFSVLEPCRTFSFRFAGIGLRSIGQAQVPAPVLLLHGSRAGPHPRSRADLVPVAGVVDDPTQGKQALQRLTTAKKDAAGRSCPGFNPLAQPDATLFTSLMAGEHCLHGFTNRDIRARLTATQLLRSCADDPKKASAKVGRCFRRLHAHGLIAKIPRTRRWRVTHYGRNVMGTSMYLREHHFPNVYASNVGVGATHSRGPGCDGEAASLSPRMPRLSRIDAIDRTRTAWNSPLRGAQEWPRWNIPAATAVVQGSHSRRPP
jgi:hypothetical protein